ncbi:MAG: zinc ribbon domain-containing protein [Anaerolineae bacterium]
MRIRPGRGRSVIAGILALVVTAGGLAMIRPWAPGTFAFIWVAVGLGAAAASFYNAFSQRGLPLYEVDLEEGTHFCPECGKPVEEKDGFCRHCGAPLT